MGRPDDAAPPGRSLGRNSLALTLSALVTGGVGLVYWVAVAKVYPAAEVGAAAAVITTATMLSAFGNLSFGAVFERFLPEAGRTARSMILRGTATGAGVGTLLGCVFLVVGPTGEMFTHTWEMVTFPLVVAVFSVFALGDHTAVGLREAGWAAGKNVTHALVKLVLALAFAFTASRLAIVWTWAVPAAIGAIVLGRLMWRRVGSLAYRDVEPSLPPRREIAEFLVSAYGIYVVSALAPLVLPLVVIAILGADANAHFAIAWSLVSAVLVLMTMLTGPFVAAAAADPTRTYSLTLRFAAVIGAVCAGGVVLFAVVGPWILGFLDPRYGEAGVPLLRLVAVALPLVVVPTLYNAIARVTRRMRLAVAVQIVNAAVILGLSTALISERGIAAMGWAYIAAEGASAVILAVPLARAVSRMRSAAE
ncbi:oligosaccharide flippase family protein [Rhodococcus triatomae]|nr:oligosaccharide flippase family protein [Rhodococcus triatomae]QNG25526.1 oligosaccharide flippase family protein [Rhodococcus triatomae]